MNDKMEVLTFSACVYSVLCKLSVAVGLPQMDLVAGSLGAFVSLAFYPPRHWSGWINYKPTSSLKMELFYWLRRTFMVMFILCAVVLVMVSLVQIMHTTPETVRWHSLDTRILSLLSCAAGQAVIPKLLNVIKRKVSTV